MVDLFALHLCLVRVDSCDFVDRCNFSWIKQTIHEITRIDTKPTSSYYSVAPNFVAKPRLSVGHPLPRTVLMNSRSL